MFWDKVRECELYFTEGIIDNLNDSHALGKLLFWMLLHGSLYPQWLNKFHVQYLLDEKIEFEKIFKEHNVQLYSQLISKKKSKALQEWTNNRDVDVSIYNLNNFIFF